MRGRAGARPSRQNAHLFMPDISAASVTRAACPYSHNQPRASFTYSFVYVLFCEQVWAVIISGCPLIGLPPSSPSFPLSPSFRTLVSQKLTRREVARHSPDGSSPVVTISWTFSAPPRLRVSPSPLQGSKGLVKAASKRGKEIEPELRCADFFQGTISNSSHRVE